jgi:hypothetical protein
MLYKLKFHCAHALVALQNFLSKLQPTDPIGYDCNRMCQDGTRENVIDKITQWTQQSQVREESLLWVRGQAGIGKSSIAASVCERLSSMNMLAACFFCKRDDGSFRDPLRLISTIAYGLATRCPEYGCLVANAIRDNMELCNLHMNQRYQGLIQRPLQELWYLTVPPLAIVIDALDECGTPGYPQKLLEILVDMSQLVPWLSVIVTSRPTGELLGCYHDISQNRKIISLLDVQEFDASNDIRAFIERSLLGVAKRDMWPNGSIDKLCQKANGIFLWASIAVQYIRGAVGSTGSRLRVALGDQGSPVFKNLDELYTNILLSGMNDAGEDNKTLFRKCMGAIIMASTRQPLPIDNLSSLLQGEPTIFELRRVVENIGSVLYLDEQRGNAVRFYHPSFADYLATTSRSQDLCISLEQENINFTRGCLQTLKEETRFNICELETSYLPNKELHNLEDLVEKKISKHLRYSCLHWIGHVVDCPPGSLHKEIQDIIDSPTIIYWIEVLSLLGKLDIALVHLPRLIKWLSVRLN